MAGALEGKSAIVTGAASGIGRAIARRFSREGARLLLADVNEVGANETAGLIADAGGDAGVAPCDVADPEQVRSVVEEAVERHGRLDIVVNVAGIGGGGRAEDCSTEDFRRVLDVNLSGPFYVAKYAIPHLRRAGGGSIINVSSVYGLIAAPNVPAYCASKGGLIMLTKQLAVDYAREGIRVNCICPGYVDTDMGGRRTRMAPDDAARALANREAKATMQPIGRQAQPEEIAGAAVFLAGDDAAFAAGSILVVDGGESILHNIGPYFSEPRHG